MLADKFLGLLQKVRPTSDASWIACCPCHDDNNPSMSIKELSNDSGETCVLMHCFACGASGVDVAEALGFKASDLFPEKLSYDHTKKQGRKFFNAMDVLRCLYHDAMTVEIVARHIEPNKPMSALALEQLHEARQRIERATSYCK